ncbi:MAG TPA: phosphoribosylformylglycinamidine cyclo-ligase, partial [Candidatus Brocadiales bacterium]|nr:phosphoribosylformylglycinamidine cyclo-ligase [Candidatus Brocadiales bacterium]
TSLKGKKMAVKSTKGKKTYAEAGVDIVKEEAGLEKLVGWVKKSFTLRDKIGAAKLDIGYFANVIDVGNGMGLAISTDGVGTKILVAQMMNKYDTIGIDCIAMNVNDVLCVGAEPISMVDYIAVSDANPVLLEEIAKGLYKGAELSKITIPGGEIAQVKEMIKGAKKGYEFDLVGTCVGTVPLDKIIIGQQIKEGDVVIGLKSSGIHSNGFTLARQALFKKGRFKIDEYIPELGRTLGEELLEPTRIYVQEVVEMINNCPNIKALIHITSDGLLNLPRVESEMGYIIDYLPEPQPIFTLLQHAGKISDEEMFKVYNMGIGFCIVIPESDADTIISIAKRHNVEGYRIGHAVKDTERKVVIEPRKLIGKESGFYKG